MAREPEPDQPSASVATSGRSSISDEMLDDWYRRWPATLPTSVPHEQVRMLIEDLRAARRVVRCCERIVSGYEARAANPEPMGGDLVELTAFASYMAARTALAELTADDGDRGRKPVVAKEPAPERKLR